MTKGIVVGCDHNQEWLLEWWWTHYSKHNRFPVAFVDFGMSKEAKRWCQSKGHWISLEGPRDFVFPKHLIDQELVQAWEEKHGPEIWHGRDKWFYKPLAMQHTPFDEAIWVDLDCEIVGPLAPLFDKKHSHSQMAVTPSLDEGYNAGVVVYHRDSPLLSQWSDLCFRHNDRFADEHDALTFLIDQEEMEVAELPHRYNWIVGSGINLDAVVLHWSGPWGKGVIRSLLC